MDSHFDFWEMSYNMGCVSAERLRGAVKWEKNKYGEISPEEYTKITGIEFFNKQ